MATIPMISVMKVEKLIRDGCEGYLAYVTKDEESKSKISKVLVVRDFSDIFLDELPKLPPWRRAKSIIGLLPGTQPITPNELRELKVQLKELVERGFT